MSRFLVRGNTQDFTPNLLFPLHGGPRSTNLSSLAKGGNQNSSSRISHRRPIMAKRRHPACNHRNTIDIDYIQTAVLAPLTCRSALE